MENQPAATVAVARRLRPRIAIDMDEVIADSIEKQLATYNRTFGESLLISDLVGRELEDVVPPARRTAVEAILHDPAFFADLAVIDGSREVMLELNERFELFIATAAMEIPTSFASKYAWLRQHFPFVPPSHLIFCGDKGVLDADFLIDDNARHFRSFRGRPLLFSAYHNLNDRAYPRVSSWSDVRQFFADRGSGDNGLGSAK